MKYDIALYKKVNDKYGLKAQMIKAIEELSELQKVLCKLLLGESLTDHGELYDELADCLIMIDQMMFLFVCEDNVNLEIDRKLARLRRKVNDL